MNHDISFSQFMKQIAIWVSIISFCVIVYQFNESGVSEKKLSGVFSDCQTFSSPKAGTTHKVIVRLDSGNVVSIFTNSCSGSIGNSVSVYEKTGKISNEKIYSFIK